MQARVRFTRCSFVGLPPLGDKTVSLPKKLVSAQEASFVFDCPDAAFYNEDATEFDTLMWEAFERFKGFDYPIATPAPGGWTRRTTSRASNGSRA